MRQLAFSGSEYHDIKKEPNLLFQVAVLKYQLQFTDTKVLLYVDFRNSISIIKQMFKSYQLEMFHVISR